IPFLHENDPFSLIQKLKSIGYTIISLEITSASVNIRDLAVAHNEKICLILGSENAGISQELLDISDKTVHIPMLGHCSSMNVAMACSIAIFEITGKLYG
ncbi:MAG TPA: TrmH family RNA methyltransferase, partial [Chlamydiales bacterium]|nr:TrmH family RNA methyltransferase [Chlamydiales bacterium]